TVLPATAKAKIDIRLADGQTPEVVLELLRKHLDKHGFEDIAIEFLNGMLPHRTNIEDPLVKAALKSAETVYEKPATIIINLAGSSPMYKLLSKGNIPGVQIGCANKDSRPHAPNENVIVEDYVEGIKMTASVLKDFSEQ